MVASVACGLALAAAQGGCGQGGAIDEDGSPSVELTSSALASEPATWTAIAGLNSRTAPSMATAAGAAHVVAVSTAGTLSHSWTRKLSDGWSAWSSLGRPASSVLDPDTAPVLVADGNTLHAFARGSDGNLYRALKTATASWSPFTALTTHGRVRGRLSVALSYETRFINGEPGPRALIVNVAFVAPSSTVEWMRLEGTTVTGTARFTEALDATLGSNQGSEVWIAVHRASTVTVSRLGRSGSAWTWTDVASRGSLLAQVYDVSDLTWFAGAFHLVYSQRTALLPDLNATYKLLHTRFIPGAASDGYSRTLTTFTPAANPDANGDTVGGRFYPEATLAVYRNKLMAAYRMPSGELRYARWDSADPTTPWIGNANVAGGFSRRRPALAAFNGRSALASADYASDNYSDDLFGASLGYSLSTIHTVDFSRAIFKRDVGRQFNIYSSNSDTLDEACVAQSDPNAPTFVSIADEDRPVLSEVGFDLWMLPSWLSEGLYQRVAQDFCERGDVDWKTQGRTPAPCSSVKMPLVVRTVNDIFVCQGAWVSRSGDYLRVWEELGHYVAEAMGFESKAGLTQANADRTGIALSKLQEGEALFKERIWRCEPSNVRCTGFTGHAQNYDVRGSQHSFMYVVYYYVNDGYRLRQFIEEDLRAGSDLLQRKYRWVKDNVFRGVEYLRQNEPLTPL